MGIIAVFGSKKFEVSRKVIKTFTEYSRNAEIKVENPRPTGKGKVKPSTYIEGPELEKVSYLVELNRGLGVDVEKEKASWYSILYALVPYSFVIGTKPVSANKWLLTSIAESEPLIDAKGRLLRVKLQLSFQEYIREGTASEAKKSSGPAGINSVISYDRSQATILFSGLSANNKRNNPQVLYALKQGYITQEYYNSL